MAVPLHPAEDLARVRLLSCDVDGVLTDGGLYYDKDGYAMARFHVLDGMGMKRLQASGIRVCIVSQSRSPAIEARARALNVDQCFVGIDDKLEIVAEYARSIGISLAEVCHVADDINDLSLLRAVGVSVTVPGGVPEVQRVCSYVTHAEGGHGAVRELCEAIIDSMTARGIVVADNS
jgi:3-deoxy-D-manno-octulosonate 8-phosphate phosphatase (KDO 8-P phosphatase)